MARPRKEGLDYFSVDTLFEENLEAFLNVFDGDGAKFILRFWQSAYRRKDGEIDCSTVLRRTTLAKRMLFGEERLIELIGAAIEFELVDEKKWKKQVLTSRGIKKRIEKVNQLRDKARDRGKIGGLNSSPNNMRRTREELANNGGKERKGNSINRDAREDGAKAPRAARPEHRIITRETALQNSGVEPIGKILKGALSK